MTPEQAARVIRAAKSIIDAGGRIDGVLEAMLNECEAIQRESAVTAADTAKPKRVAQAVAAGGDVTVEVADDGPDPHAGQRVSDGGPYPPLIGSPLPDDAPHPPLTPDPHRGLRSGEQDDGPFQQFVSGSFKVQMPISDENAAAAFGDGPVLEDPIDPEKGYVSDSPAGPDDGAGDFFADVQHTGDGKYHRAVVWFNEDAEQAAAFAEWVNKENWPVTAWPQTIAVEATIEGDEPTAPNPVLDEAGGYHEFEADPDTVHFCVKCGHSKYSDLHVLAKG